MAISVGDLFLDLNLNTAPFDKQLSGFEKSSGKFFSRVGRVIAGALSTAAIGAFAKSCLDLGSDLQEVQNVVDVTFPSMNEQINSFAKNAINQFGLSETVAKRMVGTFGAMSKAFGFSEAQAYDMSTALTGLAGDVASFYNLDPTEAYTKLKSVFSGETETLKDLGIVMTQNALDQYALANGFGKTTSAMSEQEKVILRLNFVTEQLSAASGDFARTSDSWANKVRVLALNFESLKATIGQGLINVLSPVVSIINAIISKLQIAAKYFTAFTSIITGNKKTSTTLGSVSSNIFNASTGASKLADNVAGVGKAAKKTAKAIGALASFDEINNMSTSSGAGSDTSAGGGGASFDESGLNLGSTNNAFSTEPDTSGVERACEKAKNLILGAWNSTPVQAFVGAVTTYGTLLEEYWSTLGGSLVTNMSTTWSSIQGNVSQSLTNISTLWTNFWTEIDLGMQTWGPILISGIDGIFNSMWADAIDPAIQIATQIWTDFTGIILELWNEYGAPIINNIGEFADKTIKLFQKIWDEIIEPIITPFLNMLSTLWDDHLKEMIKSLGELVLETINGALEIYNKFVQPILMWITEKLGPIFAWLSESISASIGTALGFISDLSKNIIGILTGIIKFITGVFTGNWRKAWNGVKQILSNIFSGVANIFKYPINVIIDGINSFIGGLNKIKIPDWVPGIGGFGFNIKKIPKLAEGGYVKANTPQLAMIGDNRTQGEIVSPEDKMFEIMIAALKSYGSNNANREDIQVLVSIMYEILEAIRNLRLTVDGDSLNDDQNKRNQERALRTGKLIY